MMINDEQKLIPLLYSNLLVKVKYPRQLKRLEEQKIFKLSQLRLSCTCNFLWLPLPVGGKATNVIKWVHDCMSE